MHILILPMYYPEKDSSPHRGYMFFEQAMQLVKSGCKTGLAFTEQRPLKNFTWKRFRKESHFQISAEDNGSFVTMRMHAWNPKLSRNHLVITDRPASTEIHPHTGASRPDSRTFCHVGGVYRPADLQMVQDSLRHHGARIFH